MWKRPYRKDNTISQSYTSGVVTVYAVQDVGQPGARPVEQLTEKVRLPYEEQRAGINRYYAAQQNQVQVKRVIRCPDSGQVTTQDVAITEDGTQYKIHMVQLAPGVFPVSVDVTLAQITQNLKKAEVTG